MAEHTKGPWKVTPPHNSSFKGAAWCISAPGRWVDLAAIPPHFREGGAGEAEANARLIAAAPDLLAACEAILGWLRTPPGLRDFAGGPGNENAIRLLEGAVAKARGG